MHSMRAILEDQYFVALQAAVLAADASRITPFFIAPFDILLTRVWVASSVTVTGQNTNNKHLQILDASGSALASLPLNLGTDLVANVARDIPFFTNMEIDDLTIPSGDLLSARIFQSGSGMDVAQHIMGIVFKPRH